MTLFDGTYEKSLLKTHKHYVVRIYRLFGSVWFIFVRTPFTIRVTLRRSRLASLNYAIDRVRKSLANLSAV